jgi:hypothetical protein
MHQLCQETRSYVGHTAKHPMQSPPSPGATEAAAASRHQAASAPLLTPPASLPQRVALLYCQDSLCKQCEHTPSPPHHPPPPPRS